MRPGRLVPGRLPDSLMKWEWRCSLDAAPIVYEPLRRTTALPALTTPLPEVAPRLSRRAAIDTNKWIGTNRDVSRIGAQMGAA
jgi:hypothetical protein